MWSTKPAGFSTEMILANLYLQSMVQMQEMVKDTKAASHRDENVAILS